MQVSFAAVRERYLEELVDQAWYDVRTFGKKQRRDLQMPGYLRELLQSHTVTAVEMHSHTPRSDGLIEPERIHSWTMRNSGQRRRASWRLYGGQPVRDAGLSRP